MTEQPEGDTGPDAGAGREAAPDDAAGGAAEDKATPDQGAENAADAKDEGAGEGAGEAADGDGEGAGADGEGEITLTAPEGFEHMADQVAAFASGPAKELGLTQAQAEGLVKWQAEQATAGVAAQTEMVEGWAKATRGHKEFGGDAFDANAGVARQAVEHFGGDDLKQILDDSGLGNHPAVFGAFWRMGKTMADGKVRDGSPPSAPPEDAKTILYG